jgi:hypothetical protein
MRTILLASLLLAGCAGLTAESLQRADTAQVCYIAVSQPENRSLAEAELKRRNANCQDHAAEVRRLLDEDARTNAGGMSSGINRPMGAGMGGGGMRGY